MSKFAIIVDVIYFLCHQKNIEIQGSYIVDKLLIFEKEKPQLAILMLIDAYKGVFESSKMY